MITAHNLLAMNADRMLGINSRSTAKSMERLSSGYKINRAADDAAGLAISEKMRRQIRGLRQGADNTTDGISWVKIGDGAMNEVSDMLNRMTELTIKAANGTMSESDREAVDLEMKQLRKEIDRISATTVFNDIPIFDNTNYQAKMSIAGIPGGVELFDASYDAGTKTYSFGGVIFDGNRISWDEISPDMVTIDAQGNQVFQPGDYTYAQNGLEFTVSWETGAAGPSLTRQYRVSADRGGITFAGKTFQWENLIDEDGNPASKDNVHSGVWTLDCGDSSVSFSIPQAVDTPDELAEAINACASGKVTQTMRKDYIGTKDETAVTANLMKNIWISNDLAAAFTNGTNFSIYVGADKNGVWLKDAAGTELSGSKMTWSEIGINSWDSGSDISDSKTYSYKYYSASNPSIPYLAFDFDLSEVTSIDSVIDGLDGMQLKNGTITTSYGATVENSDSVDSNITRVTSSTQGIKVSFQQEIDLGRDFNTQAGTVAGPEKIEVKENNGVDEAVLTFSNNSKNVITYTADVSNVEDTMATDVEKHLLEISKQAEKAALAGKGSNDSYTVSSLTELVGPGNITTSGQFSEQVTITADMKYTHGSLSTMPQVGQTYPTAFIDFSNVKNPDDLLQAGFDSTCMTCDKHYSVVFKHLDPVISSQIAVRYDNYAMEVNIEYLKERVTAGKTLAEALVEVLASLDFHYTQYAAGPRDGSSGNNTLYIFDYRPVSQNLHGATFYTDPNIYPNIPLGQSTYSVALNSADNGSIKLNYTYNYEAISKDVKVKVEMKEAADGEYVKNADNTFSKYNALTDNNKTRYNAVTSYKDASGKDVDIKAAAKAYAKEAVANMLASTQISLDSKDYTHMQLSGKENANMAVRALFQTTTLGGSYAYTETGIRIQHSAEADDFTEIPRFPLNSMALGLSRVSTRTIDEALSTLDSLASASNYVHLKRALYGAYQNRLEHTYDNLQNIMENTMAAESQIRDADMADEMVCYSCNNILRQTGQAMLAQANQSNRGIMSLLS